MEWINHTNVLKSINFVIVGDCYHQIAAELGKRGTTTDLSIYDRKTQNIIYTWTIPVTFPDKIQSLMQAINIAEYAILNVTKLDKYLGEQVLALDAANLKEGFVLHSYEIDEVELKKMVKGTTISNYRFLDNIDQLKQEISQVEPNGVDGECLIQIDHAFNVKGVGTVLLGIIKRGSVKTFDRLKILPTGTEILVKSIQMHDDPVSESKSPARVGLAVKGVDAADISRGDVLCSSNTQSVKLSIEDAITASFAKSAYFKGNIMENQIYSISIGVQIKPVKIKCVNVNMIEIIPDKPLTYFSGQSYALLKPDNYNGTRIVGKGIIK